MNKDKSQTIFVVDDERVIAQTLTLILEREGYLSRGFFDPYEALAAAEEAAPDLLISDVMMPSLSGVKLAIRFRQTWPSCKILLFSGNAGTVELLEDAHLAGFDFPLIGKPIHPKELLDHIEALQ